jgi:hypothetical protein
MIETVSFLGGILARLFTWGSDYLTKKQDLVHELKLLDKQIELETMRATQKRDELALQADLQVEVEWAKALNSSVAAVSAPSGNSYIDTINASVRPILTYWWCLVIYTVSKGFLLYAALQEEYTAETLAGVITTPFDQAVVGSMLGFWFADRTLRKLAGK